MMESGYLVRISEKIFQLELKGAQAVAKLLKEQRGQVAGAFYREDLGYIDLICGDSKKGLAHILERRTQQYGEQQALEFINDLPRILQEAKFYKELENKIELVTPTDMIVLGKRDDNKFVLTSFRDRRSKDRFTELENPQTRDDVGFTGKSVSEPQTKDDVLLPNQANSSTTPLKPQENPQVQALLDKAFNKWEGGGVTPQDAGLEEAVKELFGGPVYKPQFNADVQAFLKHSYGHSDLEFAVDKYLVSRFGDGMRAEIEAIHYIKQIIDNPPTTSSRAKTAIWCFLKKSPQSIMWACFWI